MHEDKNSIKREIDVSGQEFNCTSSSDDLKLMKAMAEMSKSYEILEPTEDGPLSTEDDQTPLNEVPKAY